MGECEFVGEEIFEGSMGRKCKIDKLICHHFNKPAIFEKCPVRSSSRLAQ
jgi:hypothetical protein